MEDTTSYVLKRRKEHDEALSYFDQIQKASVPSSVLDDDDIQSMGWGSNDLIHPIYSLLSLTKYIESSSELRQVVACMIANTIGYGYRLTSRDGASKDKEILTEEEIKLWNFFEYVNPDSSFMSVYERCLWDFYLTGNMYIEVLRNELTNVVEGLNHVPSYQVRISKREKEAAAIPTIQLRRSVDGYKVHKRTELKRFRRYSQSNLVSTGVGTVEDGRGVWFKEFQDNRLYSRKTGELLDSKKKVRKAKEDGGLANELVHISAPQTRGVYGLPYHIGNIVSINGDILSENINISTFQNNNIPSMLISVSGGSLTPGSCDRLADFTEAKIQNSDNRSRFLLLESETMDDDGLDSGRSKIEVKSLHETQKDDAMFQRYSDECRAAIRRAFRVPELLVGRGKAASGVVVAASMKMADEQVFSQDRNLFSDWINRKLLPELGIVNLRIELNSPNANDPATLALLLTATEKVGAMTPKIGRTILEQIMSTKYDPISTDLDENAPFALSMAEAVKKITENGSDSEGDDESGDVMNQADPSEPSQQFTSQPQGDGFNDD